jgi:integrase
MTVSTLPFGSQLASELIDSSPNYLAEPMSPKTLDDLLQIWERVPPRQLPVLQTTCSLLSTYLNVSVEELLLDSVNDNKDGFRAFLRDRKYKENSIRTYVNHVRILLASAGEYGWRAQDVPEAWRSVLEIAVEKKCDALVRHLARFIKTPADVSLGDVEQWVQQMGRQGRSHKDVQARSSRLLRILSDCGYGIQLPVRFFRLERYGIPLEQFPPSLKAEVDELLKWKQARFALDRPKDARLRPVTAKSLRFHFQGIFGFAVNELNKPMNMNLSDLIQKPIVGAFVEWSMNERKVKGDNLKRNLSLVSAALAQHPVHKSLDLSWFRPLIDSIPAAPRSEARQRKEEKYLDYAVLEAIPAKVRAERPKAQRNGAHRVATLVMEELLMKWITILPWRQRNIRECRIKGPIPNLFKGPIPPLSQIHKPDWVRQEELKDPAATFWQFKFNADETKTGIEVHALLPRQLVELLEEYLEQFRNHMLRDVDPGTLFVNGRGKAMSDYNVAYLVSRLTMRYGGRRVNPHAFRDIVAFTWLEEHPADYLTLSKMLWHSNINTTIQIYGSRFNESSGVRAMESWLDAREAKSK